MSASGGLPAARELADLGRGLDERPSALVKQATAAMQRARRSSEAAAAGATSGAADATAADAVAFEEMVALSRYRAVGLLAPAEASALRWAALRKVPVTHRCTAQAVEACYSLCHGGGCSAADLCFCE